MSSPKKVSLSNIKSKLPSYAASAKAALELRNAMFGSIAAGDMAEIVAAQVLKAKGGDTRAARYVTNLALAAIPKAPERKGTKEAIEEQVAEDTPRKEALKLLAREGPMTAAGIAGRLDYPPETIKSCLKNDPNEWFVLIDGKYGLSGHGREAAGS